MSEFRPLPLEDMLDKTAWAIQYSYECESPIETILASHLAHAFSKVSMEAIKLVPQYKWRRWRMDFAITLFDKPILFIECDGRDFHSSEQQRQRDLEKELDALGNGIDFLRFTGSQIYRRPDVCTQEILRCIQHNNLAVTR